MKNKPYSHNKRSKVLHILGAAAWVFFFLVIIHHQTSAQAFIQSYGSSTTLNEGTIVQLVPKNSQEVMPVTQNNATKTFGVVVNSQDASVALSSSGNLPNQTYVASTGHYDVIVSDQNGPIKVGNYITISAISGIGMEDNSVEPTVIGEALQSFNGSGALLGTTTVKYSNGTKQTVHLGLISVAITIAHNPIEQTAQQSYVPGFLNKLASGLDGDKVDNPWQIYLGVFILLACTVIAVSISYSGIRGSLISIGRNPLSKKSITRSFV
jgi:hypothetical protein